MSKATDEMMNLLRQGYWIRGIEYGSEAGEDVPVAVLTRADAEEDVRVVLSEAGDEEFATDLATLLL